jgi:Protein of unknown function (DUF1569)
MSINSKSVQGRRELRFTSFDEVVADAEMLVSSPNTRTLGNWPSERLLTHLALAINSSIDGHSLRAPWFIRLIGRIMKKRSLTQKMSPGLKLPKKVETGFFPAAASPHEAFKRLRAAVARTKTERMTAKHPVLGKLTHDEWTQLHLRHSELHLSFVVPS